MVEEEVNKEENEEDYKLRLNVAILEKMLYGEHDMCEDAAACSSCTNNIQILSSGFISPHPSVIILTPVLFEKLYNMHGPVNYFTVIAGYECVMLYTKYLIQTQDYSPLNIPSDNIPKFKCVQERAQKILDEYLKSVAESAKEALKPHASRLDYIQYLEKCVIYIMAIFDAITPFISKEDAEAKINESFHKLALSDLSMDVIRITKTRCGRDNMENRLQNDATWNEARRTYLKAQKEQEKGKTTD